MTPDQQAIRPNPSTLFEENLRQHLRVVERSLAALAAPFDALAAATLTCLGAGGKILACGNGGSAADAQHFAAELVGRFEKDRRALPAIALTTDSSILTSVGNDEGYERVFARQVEALARPGDLLLALSTSGGSPNVVAAARAMTGCGGRVVALVGEAGGPLAEQAEIVLAVPSRRTARIQEVHELCLHALCEVVEAWVGLGETAVGRGEG